MATNLSAFPTYSSGVMSLLPLYYVGWADSVLSPSEVKLICKQIESFSFLDKKDKILLLEWSDPSNPPSRALFRHWVNLIRKTSESLPIDKRKSLADLGIEMAKRNAGTIDDITWSAPETKEALQDLENALGLNSLEAYRNISSREQRAKEIENYLQYPSFDVSAMTQLLDDDYSELRNRMRILLSDPAFRLQTLREKSDYRDVVLQWCKLLAEQGLAAVAYPEAHGGKDNMGDYIAVFEMLGYHDLSFAIKFGVQFGLFGGSVLWLGTKRHHDKYLKDIGTLDLPGCFAMTETGHGSNVRGLETTITYDSTTDEFVVNSPNEAAGKEFIGNALHSKMASTFGQLIVDGINHGVHAILVPIRDEAHQLLKGIRVADCGYKLGLNGIDNGRIWFDNIRVPRANLLNKFGDVDENGKYTSLIESPSRRFFTMLGTLVGGRVSVPRAGLSATKTALTIAVKYALKRRQFPSQNENVETLLLDYPTHQKRLMPLLAKTYALDFALTYLAKRYVNKSEADSREIETLAAGLKSYATWFTTKAIQECREACGGKGYLMENRFADLKADTDIFTTFEGDNMVLMQLVAKGLLSSYKQAFHDDGFRAVVRYLYGQVSTSMTEMNPIFKRNTDVNHLCDSEVQLEAFRYRERKILLSVSNRMRSLLNKRIDMYDAFLRVQTHMIELAQAYVERIVLEQFVNALEGTKEKDLKVILKKLCDLYALDTMHTNKGWYLENDYMDGVKTKAIRRMVNKLCKDIRLDANSLVDAFAIPDACLAAPIVLS